MLRGDCIDYLSIYIIMLNYLLPDMNSRNFLRGRFKKSIAKDMKEFGDSTEIDKSMVYEDIWGNEAHLIMLVRKGLIDINYAREMLNCLQVIKNEIRDGKFRLDPDLEDVHMNIERYIIENCGVEYGGKLHTARSRNDQVITDVKLHLREKILDIMDSIINLQKILLGVAKKSIDVIMPGFTHLQHAQPITLGFWASSYVSMLMRDLERLNDLYSRINRCPLGAVALAGTSFDIDRRLTAKLLGFDSIHEHALDVVSSRDFIIESISVISILMSNLSRMAEDLILWSSPEFDFVELPDEYTTGSSIMPQKKNPDAAELIRGKTGRVFGALIQSLTVVKGIPSGYNRDLQEDRFLLWDSIDTTCMSLKIMGNMISGAKFNKKRMKEFVDNSFVASTEIANYLVKKDKMSFRESHEIVSNMIKELMSNRKTFKDIDYVCRLLRKYIRDLSKEDLKKLIDSRNVVEANKSLGGTASKEVERMISSMHEHIKFFEADIRKKRNKIKNAKSLTESEVMNILLRNENDIK